MDERGYLEGREMATTFNMLRANDLIWSFVVNNYLMGREPLAFDPPFVRLADGSCFANSSRLMMKSRHQPLEIGSQMLRFLSPLRKLDYDNMR